MARLIQVEEVQFASSPSTANSSLERSLRLCEELEGGNILFFPQIPFPFAQEDREFLLKQKQKSSKHRKNIAYKPIVDKITNISHEDERDPLRLLEVMRKYSQEVTHFLAKLLPSYASCWRLDFSSFRPFQEKDRKLRLRARNDLLHTDAFPTRPMHGMRILRFFTNINPTEDRKWMTSESFQILAEKFAGQAVSLPKPVNHNLFGKLVRLLKKSVKQMGLPVVLRSPYDVFMLKMHNFLKENREFQSQCPKDYWSFPPGSCWLVFTDQVSHAALAGQYALEQTILVPRSCLLNPEKSPISILERLSGENLVDPFFIEH